MTNEELEQLVYDLTENIIDPREAIAKITDAVDQAFFEGSNVGYDNACWQSVDPSMQAYFEFQRTKVLKERNEHR